MQELATDRATVRDISSKAMVTTTDSSIKATATARPRRIKTPTEAMALGKVIEETATLELAL